MTEQQAALTAADWLAAWEAGRALPALIQPCRLLAPLLAGGMAEALALPLGQRDRLLLQLHTSLFGRALPTTGRCPQCHEVLELQLDGPSLLVAATRMPPAVAIDGQRHPLRLPSSSDLQALAQQQLTLAEGRHWLAARCLTGDSPPLLDEMAVAAIAAAVAEADPQATIELALACPACGHGWPELFDIGSYLWSRLCHWAERLLDEVHLLASRYGWSEAQILALSPARRAHYLQRVLA